MIKKYLNENGVAHILSKLDDYPNNEILSTVINAIQELLDEKAMLSILAPYEALNIASQSYAVNSYLTYNGQLYKVILAIDQGDTLIPDVNIEATTVMAELNS